MHINTYINSYRAAEFIVTFVATSFQFIISYERLHQKGNNLADLEKNRGLSDAATTMLNMTARRLRNFAIDLCGARPAIICRLPQLFLVPQYVYCYSNRIIHHCRQPSVCSCLTV
jgi:hypothetical protein